MYVIRYLNSFGVSLQVQSLFEVQIPVLGWLEIFGMLGHVRHTGVTAITCQKTVRSNDFVQPPPYVHAINKLVRRGHVS